MLAKDLLKDIRYSLSDTTRERWSDERLLSLMSEAIKDLAAKTILFVETVFVVVQNNVVDIDLSDRATKIIRAEYLDELLALTSFAEMDAKNKAWQKEKGDTVKALVYDKQKRGLLKLYPIPQNNIADYVTYPNGLYGIVTDISYSDIQPVMHDHYGDISGVPDNAIIKLYYIRKHLQITDVNQELYIDELCEAPIKRYVVGCALRDNIDSQNRTFGTEELNRYYQLVNEYSLEKEQNFSRPLRNTEYRPMG